MRVTFTLPCHGRKPIGGVRVVYEYANGLAERGHEVTVVHAALMEPWQYAHRLRWRREARVVVRGVIDVIASSPSSPSWQRVHPEVRLQYGPTLAATHVPDGDAVVATSWRTAESVARYPASKGLGHYLIQHYETWDGPAPRVDATWRAPLRKVVIAGWLEDQAAALGAADVVRVPNAIDHGVFRLTRAVGPRPPRVAMLWSPAAIKGGVDGIRALVEARRAVPDLQAVFFGVSPRPARLPAWIEYRRNPSPSVLVNDIYNGSAIYLCPSWSEGWHLPPAEAMACGCALVSTQQGGVLDYAVAEETALLAPVGAIDQLASHIVRLCTDSPERIRLSTSGRERICAFTWARSLEQFERVLVMSAVRS